VAVAVAVALLCMRAQVHDVLLGGLQYTIQYTIYHATFCLVAVWISLLSHIVPSVLNYHAVYLLMIICYHLISHHHEKNRFVACSLRSFQRVVNTVTENNAQLYYQPQRAHKAMRLGCALDHSNMIVCIRVAGQHFL
jgi:hypothetical protein